MRITILGRGAYGVALGNILEKNHHQIVYYDIKDGGLLDDALNNTEAILITVPSEALPNLLTNIPYNLPTIVATKGILDLKIFKNFSDLIALSGAGFADDLLAEKTTTLTTTDARVLTWFAQNWLKFEITDDVKGIFMCGALKNIYAMQAGRLSLERDTPEWTDFINNALNEMRSILYANGAHPDTANLSCGKADLELTCGLPSRNYEYGTLIAKNPNYKPEKTVEGRTALNKIKSGVITIPSTANILTEIMEEKWG